MLARVLVVEDDPLARDELAQILSDQRYVVTGVANGADALSALRRMAILPSVILLDLHTPKVNGWQFRGQQIRDPDLAAVPIVVMSGDADVARHAASLAAAGYLRKPFDLDSLLGVLEVARVAPTTRPVPQP